MDTKASKKNYSLYEVYKIYDEGAPITNHLGGWSLDSGYLEIDNMDKNSRRHDLRVSNPFGLIITYQAEKIEIGLRVLISHLGIPSEDYFIWPHAICESSSKWQW